MVAGAVAGLGAAGSAVVIRLFAGYWLLAVASLLLAGLLPGAHARGVSAAEGPLYVYQQLAGPLDGRSCPSWPACSLYARQALEAHGLLFGSWLVLDRLIHEGGDMQFGPKWLAADGQRLYDPLARNDAWLRAWQHDNDGE